MWYLYLDESGDLGFDFINKKPSKFFTITILAVNGVDHNRQLINAVKKTAQRKLNHKRKKNYELKGTTSTLKTKQYFYQKVKDIEFGLYSLTTDKRKLLNLTDNKERIYNFIAGKVISAIPFKKLKPARIELIVDKSKGTAEINEFNQYIKNGLQACDIFCHGISQNNERGVNEWFNLFERKKVKFNEILRG